MPGDCSPPGLDAATTAAAAPGAGAAPVDMDPAALHASTAGCDSAAAWIAHRGSYALVWNF